MKYKNRLIVPTIVSTSLLASTMVANAEEVDQDEQYSNQSVEEYSINDETSETDLDFIESEEDEASSEETEDEDSEENSEEASDESDEETNEPAETEEAEETVPAEETAENLGAPAEVEASEENTTVEPDEQEAEVTTEPEAAEETEAVESVEIAEESAEEDKVEDVTAESVEEPVEAEESVEQPAETEQNTEAPVETAAAEENTEEAAVETETQETEEQEVEESAEPEVAAVEEAETEEVDEAVPTETENAEPEEEPAEDIETQEASEETPETSASEDNTDEEVTSESDVQQTEEQESETPQSEETTYKYDSESLNQELENLSAEEQTAFLEENADDIEVDEEMLNSLSEVLAEDNEEINADEVSAATASTLSTMSLSQAITDINDYIAENDFEVAPIQYDYIPGLPNYAYHSDHGWKPENGVVGKPEGVVLHDVGNDNSTIHGEISYMTRNQENAFVHAFVDANNIIQVADTDYLAYGAGPVSNQLHMHVELVRHDNAHDFAKSINNYADYIANLLYKYKLPAVSAEETGEGTLWSHVAVSNHLGGTASPDPYDYFARFNYEYNDVISLITDRYNDMYNKRTTPQISMPVDQGTTELLAEVNANNLGLYESVTDARTKDASNLLGQTFYVVRTATYNYDEYYLLEDENGVSLGWMYAGDLTTSEYVPEVEEDETIEEPTPEEPEVTEPTEPEEDSNEPVEEEPTPTEEEDNETDEQQSDEDNTSTEPENNTEDNTSTDTAEDTEDENQEQEEPANPETPQAPVESEDDASEDAEDTNDSTDNNATDSDDNDNQSEEESTTPADDSNTDDTTDEGSADESGNQSEDNNNEETDNSDQQSEEQEAGVSDDTAEDTNQPAEDNGNTTESDMAEDEGVSSSLVDSATGVRVVSATDELEGKSVVVTVMNPSNAIGAQHDLYDIHILDENGSLYSLNNPVTVYLPANGYVSNVYYLGDIGETLEGVNFRTEDGYAVFEVNSFSQYAVVYGNESEDNTTVPVVTADSGTGGKETMTDQANEHPTVYTEKDMYPEGEAAAAGSDDANQGGTGGTKEAEPEMLPDTGTPEQSTTIFAAILAALGLGFLVKRRKTTEK